MTQHFLVWFSTLTGCWQIKARVCITLIIKLSCGLCESNIVITIVIIAEMISSMSQGSFPSFSLTRKLARDSSTVNVFQTKACN